MGQDFLLREWPLQVMVDRRRIKAVAHSKSDAGLDPARLLRSISRMRRHVAGAGSLIPAERSYIQHRNQYDGHCKAAGLKNMHGLRHHYAQARYEAITSWKAPKAGGPSTQSLTPAQRGIDMAARAIISQERGHARTEITKVYLGR